MAAGWQGTALEQGPVCDAALQALSKVRPAWPPGLHQLFVPDTMARPGSGSQPSDRQDMAMKEPQGEAVLRHRGRARPPHTLRVRNNGGSLPSGAAASPLVLE